MARCCERAMEFEVSMTPLNISYNLDGIGVLAIAALVTLHHDQRLRAKTRACGEIEMLAQRRPIPSRQ